jgi:hypothetical protein
VPGFGAAPRVFVVCGAFVALLVVVVGIGRAVLVVGVAG